MANATSSRPEKGPVKNRQGRVTASSSSIAKSKARKAWWSWGIGLGVLGALLTLATWRWPFHHMPGIYAVRVAVLDPQGRPIVGATVRASAGNEPQMLPDGWWEVEIPAAKVPANGWVSLWAEHENWD